MTRPSLLIVDDEQLLADVIRDTFAMRGFAAASVTSVADAMVEIESRRFDLLLSDVRMPMADGIELLERLGDGSKPDLRVFLMSGFLDILTPEALDRGAWGIFQKPLKLDVLEKAFRRQLLPPAERWREAEVKGGPIIRRSLPPFHEAVAQGSIELGREGFFLKGEAFGLEPGAATGFAIRFADGAALEGTGKVIWNRDKVHSVYAAGCGILIESLVPGALATFEEGLGAGFVKSVVPLGIPKKYR